MNVHAFSVKKHRKEIDMRGIVFEGLEQYLLGANLFHFMFCIFLILFMRVALENQNNSHMRIWFKRFVVVAFASVFFDMLTYVFDRQTFPGARIGHQISMFLTIFLTAFVGTLWNRFFDIIFRIDNLKIRRWVVYLTPTLIALVLLIINCFNGMMYTISPNNVYTRGDHYWISFTVQYVSFALVIIRALVYDLGVKTLRRRRMRNGILWLGVLTLVFGVFQAISDGKLAVNCLGITTGIFIMFVRFQDEQITNDILTTLHNRYALDTHINDKMKEYASGNRKGSALYFIMMDVDNFKSINDVYGHNEGDEVLRSIAFQLKKVGMKYKAELFLARYAGDEFCAVFESPSRERVDELVSDIKNEVSLLSEERGHHMSISVGYAAYAGKNMDIETLFELADKALYIDKFGAKPENIPQEIETDVEI